MTDPASREAPAGGPPRQTPGRGAHSAQPLLGVTRHLCGGSRGAFFSNILPQPPPPGGGGSTDPVAEGPDPAGSPDPGSPSHNDPPQVLGLLLSKHLIHPPLPLQLRTERKPHPPSRRHPEHTHTRSQREPPHISSSRRQRPLPGWQRLLLSRSASAAGSPGRSPCAVSLSSYRCLRTHCFPD